MSLFELEFDPLLLELGRELAESVDPKYRPAFEKLPENDRAKAALYFLPHGSKKDVLGVSRPRVVKWYGPLADQNLFPSGHRYCINVYTGCDFSCRYCYVNGYSLCQPAKLKEDFRRNLLKDLEDLEKFDVPPAPLHLSNSTDALQPIELKSGNTLFTLEQLAHHRKRFTTITLLTKNPAILQKDEYLAALQSLCALPKDHPKSLFFEQKQLPPFLLECSLAFWNDESRKIMDPSAPGVEERKSAIQTLRKAGIPLALRIDPLFPRDPLPGGKKMKDFGLRDFQPLSDLEALVRFSRDIGIVRIIYSVLKITKPRAMPLSVEMDNLRSVFSHISPHGKAEFRGNSWRLADSAIKSVAEPLLNLCAKYGLEARMCKSNLLETP